MKTPSAGETASTGRNHYREGYPLNVGGRIKDLTLQTSTIKRMTKNKLHNILYFTFGLKHQNIKRIRLHPERSSIIDLQN